MILPTKYISEDQSLLGVGAVLLPYIDRPHTITSLWDKVKGHPSVATFERFILALDLLYIMGVINYSRGIILRSAS